jgi:Fe-S oxidoreductase/FAD/FMN-containing dehydrogenase
MGGKTSDNVASLDVLTYDGLRLEVGPTSEDDLARTVAQGGRRGSIYAKLKRLRDRYAGLIRERFPRIPRRVSGYGLEHLLPENGFHVARALTGTEGTCVFVLGATLDLVHSPPARTLLVLGYPDVFAAGDAVAGLMAYRSDGLLGLEGFDARLVEDCQRLRLHTREVAMLPPGGGWLLLEFGGETPDEAGERAKRAVAEIERGDHAPQTKLFEDRAQQEGIWKVREAGLGATARVPNRPDTWEGWEDSAVPPERVGDYLRDLRGLMDRFGYTCSFYGHFGQGCIHTRVAFDLATRHGLDQFRGFIEAAADTVLRYGGSVSGEHGDGQSRAELLPKMFGPELVQAFGEFKAIWDPQNKMNPGKVVRPYRLDQNVKLGIHYRPPALDTYFQYPDDNGSFAHATLRCVGVGKCRSEGGGTMCPSYMVTREEMHSTRGRARLLFEMLQGQEITAGWRSQHVKDALDLCLACKGCKGDCPVHVDMATYKAEFLAHYYAGRLRPRSACTMGLIYWWARLAALAPRAANVVTQAPLLGGLAKRVAGVAPQRRMPVFAQTTFKAALRKRAALAPQAPVGANQMAQPDRKAVILWADTFNNHFYPDVQQAALEVLQAAGFRVAVPTASLCCGRPLYDYGFLSQAKGLLRQIMRALGPEIDAGVPVVGLEPSCVAVFRDELTNLFPHDQRAQRLSQQSYLLDEFLAQHAPDFHPPHLGREALVHGHCHQKALMGMDATTQVLDRIGVRYRVLDSGCCGMAGSFGFEPGDHYDVSLKAGERVLLPAVREAPPDTLVVADGFSCREQIAQTTDRRAVHLAQVLQMALRGDY